VAKPEGVYNNWVRSAQIRKIFIAGSLMAIGLLLFKFLPMGIWGRGILFDASAHLTVSIFFLYIIWFFIDQNKDWRNVFFIFCALVLSIVSFQRIAANAHSDIGLLLGLILSLFSIFIAERRRFKGRIKF